MRLTLTYASLTLLLHYPPYTLCLQTFDVLDAFTSVSCLPFSPSNTETATHRWFANVSDFPALDSQLEMGPTFELEYSTREAYGAGVQGWGPNDPLNATWWHLVTEGTLSQHLYVQSLTLIHVVSAMETNQTLVDLFNSFQGKKSLFTQPCTGACATARICYMRSGSASLALQNCAPGFGSVG